MTVYHYIKPRQYVIVKIFELAVLLLKWWNSTREVLYS